MGTNMSKNLLSTLSGRAIGKAAHVFAGRGLDETLGWVGLSRRQNRALPVAGYFALGAFIGASAALLLATEKGQRTRQRVWGQLQRARAATVRLVSEPLATKEQPANLADNGIAAQVHHQPEHAHQS